MRALCLLFLPFGLSTHALAQDLETPGTIESDGSPVQVQLDFDAEWHEYNNLDFRDLDESSDQAILDSDDKFSFAYTGISADILYRPDSGPLSLVTNFGHRGLWGGDQLGMTNSFGSWLVVGALHIDYRLSETNDRHRLIVGRQYFEIGGLGGTPDYVFADVVDLARVDIGLGTAATLVLVPVNVAATTPSDDQAAFLEYTAQTESTPYGLRGDRLTKRHGMLLVVDGLDAPVEGRAYAFYTDIGGPGSGADISYQGTQGNFTDNDWVMNYGLRLQVAAGPVTPFAAFDGSMGIDRKELIVNDVDTRGSAITAGATVDTEQEPGTGGFKATASFFRALGPAYGADGLMYSHGFVGMKGRHTGGTIAGRFLGWHPTAYVGRDGIADDPHEPDRKTGTQVIHASAGFDLAMGLGASVSWWSFADTGLSGVDINNLDLIDPPYGYSREAYAAQERLGLSLGQELNLEVHGKLSERLELYANGAMLLPGAFYAIEVARVAGTQLGGEATALGAYAGARASF